MHNIHYIYIQYFIYIYIQYFIYIYTHNIHYIYIPRIFMKVAIMFFSSHRDTGWASGARRDSKVPSSVPKLLKDCRVFLANNDFLQ